MPEYHIRLTRTVSQRAEVLVTADTIEEATERAKDRAGDLDWHTDALVEDPEVEKAEVLTR